MVVDDEKRTKARLMVAAHAAKTVLEFLDRPQYWLSKEAERDLKRLVQTLDER